MLEVGMTADEPIRLVAPDPSWPARFESESEALKQAIGEWIDGGIHHVGSTAVPGLEAKPIIDILVGVGDLESSRACFEALADRFSTLLRRAVFPRQSQK